LSFEIPLPLLTSLGGSFCNPYHDLVELILGFECRLKITDAPVPDVSQISGQRATTLSARS